MADNQSYDPPQDTGMPDAVETDPAALNSAEDLDEDRIHVDPLEEGMDPPEHWSEVDKYGMTPWEQAHPAPLDQRLAEEQPDVLGTEQRENSDRDSSTMEEFDEHTAPENSVEYGEELGISADYAGGSIPDEIRTPPPAP